MTAQDALDFVLKCRKGDSHMTLELTKELIDLVYRERIEVIKQFSAEAQAILSKHDIKGAA
jgi:hypothetical protein